MLSSAPIRRLRPASGPRWCIMSRTHHVPRCAGKYRWRRELREAQTQAREQRERDGENGTPTVDEGQGRSFAPLSINSGKLLF